MKKHILITAGGTVEPIDSVRKIQNTSTGNLCARIYEAFADHISKQQRNHDQDFVVHYVVSETAVRPKEHTDLPILFYPVTDVNSVESVLKELLRTYPTGYIIHGMAVSDYTKDYLIDREELILELSNTLKDTLTEDPTNYSTQRLKTIIRKVIQDPQHQLDTSKKIQSKSDLILALKRTPKLIEMIRNLSPNSFLVGFKLLKDVSEGELIKVASELLKKNDCDLVLANDLSHITADRHQGVLIKDDKIIGKYNTKKEIANGLVKYIFDESFDINDGSTI